VDPKPPGRAKGITIALNYLTFRGLSMHCQGDFWPSFVRQALLG
jgi:hypothetical protein